MPNFWQNLKCLYILLKWVVNYFPNDLGYHMPCEFLDGVWETRTHLKVHGDCHVLTSSSRGMIVCIDQYSADNSSLSTFLDNKTKFVKKEEKNCAEHIEILLSIESFSSLGCSSIAKGEHHSYHVLSFLIYLFACHFWEDCKRHMGHSRLQYQPWWSFIS